MSRFGLINPAYYALPRIGARRKQDVLSSKSTATVQTSHFTVVVTRGSDVLFGSRFMHRTESRYAPAKGEAMGVVDALNKARLFRTLLWEHDHSHRPQTCCWSFSKTAHWITSPILDWETWRRRRNDIAFKWSTYPAPGIKQQTHCLVTQAGTCILPRCTWLVMHPQQQHHLWHWDTQNAIKTHIALLLLRYSLQPPPTPNKVLCGTRWDWPLHCDSNINKKPRGLALCLTRWKTMTT